MAIVTLSRRLGSHGTLMAESLQSKLNLPRLDKSSLERIFSDYGETFSNLERFDEKRPSFWDNFSSQKDRYLHFLKTAVYDFVATGNALILGRGGHAILSQIPGTLKILVTAPMKVRIQRLMEKFSIDEGQAASMIHRSDQERSGFHRFFFDMEWDSPDGYDLVINTRELEMATAVEMVRDILESTPFREQADNRREFITNLHLGHKVATVILYMEKIPIQFLEAEACDGEVVLRGSTVIRADIERCEEAAKKVPGVKSVDNRIQFVPMTFSMG